MYVCMYNLYPSTKYQLVPLDIIQPTVGKQQKEFNARTPHLEGRTTMSETIESLERTVKSQETYRTPLQVAKKTRWSWKGDKKLAPKLEPKFESL